jgi:hypothetical protein
MEHLGHRDYWMARKAHRVFRVDHAGAPRLRARRAYLWTRVDPDEACRRGRTDILRFLYEHHRVPRTTSARSHATRCGDRAIFMLAIEREPLDPRSQRFSSEIRTAVTRGHVDLALDMYRHYGRVDYESDVSTPCPSSSSELISQKWCSMTFDYKQANRTAWIRIAATHGCFGAVTSISVDRDATHPDDNGIERPSAEGSIPLLRLAIEVSRRHVMGSLAQAWPEAIGQAARAKRHDLVRYLYGIAEARPSFDPDAALVTLSRLGYSSAVAWILERDGQQRLDRHAARDAAMDSHHGAPVLLVLARHGVRVDFQSALVTYAQRGQVGAVEFLCSKGARHLDLEAALVETADGMAVMTIIRHLPRMTDFAAMAWRMRRAGRRDLWNALLHRARTHDWR